MMKEFSILILLVLCVVVSHSQNRVIEYAFGKKVDNEIRLYIDSMDKKNPGKRYYCVLNKLNIEYRLDIQYYDVNDSSLFLETIQNTNRFLILNDDIRLPIVFEFDLSFAMYGKDNQGRNRRVYKIFENPCYIIFNSEGEVLKSERKDK